MAPRAILLDALGTLIALEPPAPRLIVLMRERHGIELDRQLLAGALRTEMGYYREQCIRASDDERLQALRLECAAILARELGGPVAELPLAWLMATLLDSLSFHPYPDARYALTRWRAAGARLVVASNWDVSLHAVLRESGLDELIDAVATSAEVGVAKPSGELFAAALSLAGAQSWQSVHIGDSLVEDVEGARAAGIEAVWLRRDGAREGPPAPPGVRVISTLAEF